MAFFCLPREILFGVNLGVTLNETLHSTCSKTVPWSAITRLQVGYALAVETVYLFFLGVLKFRSPGTSTLLERVITWKKEQLEIEKPDLKFFRELNHRSE